MRIQLHLLRIFRHRMLVPRLMPPRSAGPPERIGPNSAPRTSAEFLRRQFLSRCRLRYGCSLAQLMAPDLPAPDEAVEVRFACPQRLIWCLAIAVHAIRPSIFVLAPSAGPARAVCITQFCSPTLTGGSSIYGLQATEQHQVGFPQQLSPSFVR